MPREVEMITPTNEKTAQQMQPLLVTTATPKPSRLENVKNFFKNKYVRRTLFALGIIVGLGLACTGLGMLGLLCAGAVTAAAGTIAALSAAMVAAFGGGVAFSFTSIGFLAVGLGFIGFTLRARVKLIQSMAPTPGNSAATTPEASGQTTDGQVTKALKANLTEEQRADGIQLASEVFPKIREHIEKEQSRQVDILALNRLGMHAAGVSIPASTSNPFPPDSSLLSPN